MMQDAKGGYTGFSWQQHKNNKGMRNL